MFCPKCASLATPGQRFCRACGTDLGLIVDAMDGKRLPVDFESLKADLRVLGSNLRAGFEEAKQGFSQSSKKTRSLAKPDSISQVLPPIPVKVKKVRGGSTRQFSFQHATLSILGGGALSGALYYILLTAQRSGLLLNVERELMAKFDLPYLAGLAPVLGSLWVLALIPTLKGFAHLLNGAFFAAKSEPEIKEVVISVPTEVNFSAVQAPRTRSHNTNDLEPSPQAEPIVDSPQSVTDDETMRFGT